MKKLEIFKPGRHTAMNGAVLEFSDAQLLATAQAYDPALREAPLVVGHPTLDAPAYGWVKSLSYADGSLYADPDQVDPAFAELVNAGRYKKISASFYTPTAKSNPKPGTYYLRHVGFLGAQAPAVAGLKSASFAHTDDGVIEFAQDLDASIAQRIFGALRELMIGRVGTEEAGRMGFADTVINPMESEMDKPQIAIAIKWLKAAIKLHEDHMAGRAPTTGPDGDKSQAKMMGQMRQALAALTGDIDDKKMDMAETNIEGLEMDKNDIVVREQKLKANEAAFAEREKKLQGQEAQARRVAVAAFAEGLVKDGKLLPRDQAPLIEFMAAVDDETAIEFAEGDERKTMPRGQWLRELLGRLPTQVDYVERAKGDSQRAAAGVAAPHGYSVDPARAELHAKAVAYAESNKCEYITAVAAVSK